MPRPRGKSYAGRVPELSGCRDDDIERNELDASVEQHNQDDQAAQTMADQLDHLLLVSMRIPPGQSRRHLGLSCSAADRPRRPKSIDQHAECFGKEGFAALAGSPCHPSRAIERSPRLDCRFIAERDGEALHTLVGCPPIQSLAISRSPFFERKLPMASTLLREIDTTSFDGTAAQPCASYERSRRKLEF